MKTLEEIRTPILLTCSRCGASKKFPSGYRKNGLPVLVWFENQNKLCTPCNDAKAKALAGQGAQAAADHADSVHDGWQDEAYFVIKQFIAALKLENKTRFTPEEVRVFAKYVQLPDPPDNRAWGAPMKRAAKENLLRKIGDVEAKDPKVHKRLVSLWEIVQ